MSNCNEVSLFALFRTSRNLEIMIMIHLPDLYWNTFLLSPSHEHEELYNSVLMLTVQIQYIWYSYLFICYYTFINRHKLMTKQQSVTLSNCASEGLTIPTQQLSQRARIEPIRFTLQGKWSTNRSLCPSHVFHYPAITKLQVPMRFCCIWKCQRNQRERFQRSRLTV